MKNLWHKNAIIYGVDVKTFQDSNNDGIGDFPGLISRLDYLAELGITCLWVLPFYKSPCRDNGYDVSDFYTIDPRLGNLDDFQTFIKEAHKRKIRVIIDLVIHHTSTEHPWFKAARADEKSSFRNYYIWSKKRPKGAQPPPAFPGHDDDVWHYDEIAKAWYFHQFYHFQPDLNFVSEEVQKEIFKITKYWLALGVDGLRVDAAGLLFSYKGLPYTKYQTPWVFLKNLNSIVDNRTYNAVLLGEVDLPPEEMKTYFGKGDRIHMLLNFLMNQTLYAALATENSDLIEEIVAKIPAIPQKNQWVNFLRNLDELNMDKLSEENQKHVYEKFGNDAKYKIFNRGLRRRVAPMFNNNQEQLKMVYTLLFALPGVPLICYGDEIGMGEDISLYERESVRLPMQWSNEINAGFSKAKKSELIRPVLSTGEHGFKKINVKNAKKDKNSLYYTIKQLIALRKKLPILSNTDPDILKLNTKKVAAFRYEWKGRILITLCNLANQDINIFIKIVELRNKKFKEIWSDKKYPENQTPGNITLGAYGYRWFYLDK